MAWHDSPALLRCIVGSSLLFAAVPVSGSDATGSMGFYKCSTIAWAHLTLDRFRGRPLEKTIVFTVWDHRRLEPSEKEWSDNEALECAKPDQCESATHARIRFSHLSSGKVSGDFAIEFRDGRKLEGSFRAKRIRPPKPIICD